MNEEMKKILDHIDEASRKERQGFRADLRSIADHLDRRVAAIQEGFAGLAKNLSGMPEALEANGKQFADAQKEVQQIELAAARDRLRDNIAANIFMELYKDGTGELWDQLFKELEEALPQSADVEKHCHETAADFAVNAADAFVARLRQP